ncbi:MAG: transketolase [Alphaproteobacteria bacterium]|nr:transketolase [Alphaproteobacteria bacterium]
MTLSPASLSETSTQTPITHQDMANAIRFLAIDAVEKANSGHPGMPMGMADVATVLFQHFIKFDPKDSNWPDRDRLILSAGHGSMLLYALLHLTGYEDVTLDELKRFRQLGSKTPGHPEYGYTPGVETTTGPLGQGLANAVGMALAERILASRFGKELVDHRTYVIVGDGCLMEGISHEAISLAGHLQLNKLIVLFDDNGITIDGPTNLSVSDDQLGRFKASGWNVVAIDGHNPQAIHDAIKQAKSSDKPSLIACKTTIAYGAPTKAGKSSSHGSPLGKDEISGTRKNLTWDHEPFHVPEDVLSAWREIGKSHQREHEAWQHRLNQSSHKREFKEALDGTLPANLSQIVQDIKQHFIDTKCGIATRASSGETLEVLTKHIHEMIGGSADLTGSNNTLTKELKAIKPHDFSGRYMYYGVREHAMAAAMNGMALHKGIIPYSGTFLVFTDYCRPAIRLSALMKQRVVYVMTHDSIGLGEDGPTHQPVEHLASLRAIPNLLVLRPCDAVEVAECWEIALRNTTGPSILALTRQGLPLQRHDSEENKSAKGAYILSESPQDIPLQVTIFATGSEIQIAMKAKQDLEQQHIGVRVVSMVSTELFDKQPMEYQVSILCTKTVKVAIEAAVRYGWDKYIGPHGIFVGMESFGESAPAGDLYKYFRITAEEVVTQVTEALNRK